MVSAMLIRRCAFSRGSLAAMSAWMLSAPQDSIGGERSVLPARGPER